LIEIADAQPFALNSVVVGPTSISYQVKLTLPAAKGKDAV
jgi:hypothetical protein